MNYLFFLKTIFRILKYIFFGYRRYAHILINVLISQPNSILEIGVYQGRRSIEMIEAAKIFPKKISYYGFDLFDLMNEDIKKKEISKIPLSQNEIYNKLDKLAEIKLYKGFSDKTLPKFVEKEKLVDFIFIDGGHSRETIYNDWINVKKLMKKNTIVMFDDYYIGQNSENYGCKFIFDDLDKNLYTWKVCYLKDIVYINNYSFKNSLTKLSKIIK